MKKELNPVGYSIISKLKLISPKTINNTALHTPKPEKNIITAKRKNINAEQQ